MNWIIFLHIYQPPNQEVGVLDQVAQESYNYILKLLKKYPNLKITLNISGSLLEQMKNNGLLKIAEEIKKQVKAKKIELVGSAMYHPILPLLPIKEIQRQIKLQDNICQEVFGNLYQPQGFFMPEMAYDKKTADVIKKMGFKWIILDQAHFPGKKIDNTIKYKIKENGLTVLFRNRKYSKDYPPRTIVNNFEDIKEEHIITAHDGELYGHWHKTDDENYAQNAFGHKKIKTATISKYLSQLKTTKTITPKKANWESTPQELKNKVYYGLWDDPKNKIHKLLWDLRELAIKTINKNTRDPQYSWARNHLDRGLASCSWWWAAEKQPDAFSPITWNPTEIEKGLKELISSVRSLEKINPQTKLKAEKIYLSLVKLIWNKHWKKYA